MNVLILGAFGIICFLFSRLGLKYIYDFIWVCGISEILEYSIVVELGFYDVFSILRDDFVCILFVILFVI